jgi:F420-non-reducing hydrogenase iron-sulfur subunit
MKYPPNLRVIRVMCSGRVDPNFVLEALARGADGVLVLGCHPGDCHYSEGNYKCQRRVPLTRKLAEQMGIDPRRIRLEWVSASEGARFTQVVTEFTEQVRALGPLHLAEWTFDRASADAQLAHESR